MAGSNQDVSPIEGAIIASEQNLVVLSSNYRLGAFGFLFSEFLDDRISEEHGLEYYEGKITSGNQGLMDQQMAMIWTAENAKVSDFNSRYDDHFSFLRGIAKASQSVE